jgi:phage terminase large subunit-like protein
MLETPRDCPPRYATARTPGRKTLGDAAARIAEQLGTPLMPWQRMVLDVALEIENGQFVYKEIIVTVPRQSGKTTMMLSLILARALGLTNQRIVYTAQTRADARKKWAEEWLPVLQLSQFSDHIKTRQANGDEALIFPETGSRQGLIASTAKAGHGQTLDLGIVDEAFAQPDARLEQSLKPAMITRNMPPHKGAQLWIVSTAGTLTSSPYLLGKVEAGREIATSGLNKQVAYFEWSASEDDDPADESTWWGCMPALGRTAMIDSIRTDFLSMDLHEFQRAYLNQWTTISVDPVIPLTEWNQLNVPFDSTGIPAVLAIDVTPDRSASSIAAAGQLPDGKIFVEVIKHQQGIKWVVPAIKQIVASHEVRAIVLDTLGPAGSLVDELETVYVTLKKVTAQELGRACSMIYDAATDYRSLVHRGQPDVSAALDGGAKRPIGDGGWAWGRKNSGVDISPLVAITLAHWYVSTNGTSGAGVWNLDEIVQELRERRAAEGGQETITSREPQPLAGGVTFVPLT